MITLDNTTRKIQVVLSGAKSSADCPFVATYEDVAGSGGPGGGPPSRQASDNNGVTNGVTAVDVVPVIGSFLGSTTRQLKSFSLFNADNAAITPTIQYNDNGTTRAITTLTLQVGETLSYEDGRGWLCLDTNGNMKTNQPASSGAASTAQQLATSAWSVITQIAAPASVLSASSQASSIAALSPASASSQASSIAALSPASASSQASSLAAAIAPASVNSVSSQASSMAAQNPATVSSLQSAASVQSFTSTNWSTVSSATSRVKSSFSW